MCDSIEKIVFEKYGNKPHRGAELFEALGLLRVGAELAAEKKRLVNELCTYLGWTLSEIRNEKTLSTLQLYLYVYCFEESYKRIQKAAAVSLDGL